MTTPKAFITTVTFGLRSLEMLMDEQKNLYIATPELVNRGLLTTQHNAPRQLQSILGKEFGQPTKLRTVNNTTVTAVPLAMFEKLLAKLDRAGNLEAQQFRDELVGLSLTQVGYDGFGVKFEIAERQDYLLMRQDHVAPFKEMSKYGAKDGLHSGSSEYGARCREIKLVAGLPVDISVSAYNSSQGNRLIQFEFGYSLLREDGCNHNQALSRLANK